MRAFLMHLQAVSTQGDFFPYFDIWSFDHFIYPWDVPDVHDKLTFRWRK
jgi:hypothetical protein